MEQLVWRKLAPHLGDAKTILIVGDGSLSQVPWHAIPSDASNRLLIEDYAIASIPFGQHLVELLGRAPPTGDQLLAIGDVDYGGTTGKPWTTLEETGKEARAIAELWKSPGKATVLEGPAPTEANVAAAMAKARYIHLATHGFFADSKLRTPFQPASARGGASPLGMLEQPFQPALRNPLALVGVVLAGANHPQAEDAADGVLTGEELDGLDLMQAELVVLSACETGLGQVEASEGVLGLQRTLHLQGARTVVGSLWKVDDDATRALMIEFYKNLWSGKLGKLEALRQAQLTMLRQYDRSTRTLQPRGIAKSAVNSEDLDGRLPPYYWAAFVLSGDWR
jgi:CHAT domain-containing protein